MRVPILAVLMKKNEKHPTVSYYMVELLFFSRKRYSTKK